MCVEDSDETPCRQRRAYGGAERFSAVSLFFSRGKGQSRLSRAQFLLLISTAFHLRSCPPPAPLFLSAPAEGRQMAKITDYFIHTFYSLPLKRNRVEKGGFRLIFSLWTYFITA